MSIPWWIWLLFVIALPVLVRQVSLWLHRARRGFSIIDVSLRPVGNDLDEDGRLRHRVFITVRVDDGTTVSIDGACVVFLGRLGGWETYALDFSTRQLSSTGRIEVEFPGLRLEPELRDLRLRRGLVFCILCNQVHQEFFLVSSKQRGPIGRWMAIRRARREFLTPG